MMKPYKICLFIFSIIGVLACISAVFPADGVQMGDAEITFPSLSDMLWSDTASLQPQIAENQTTTIAIDSDLLILDSLQQVAIAPYIDFFEKAPNRIYFPNNDITYFDSLYAALDNAQQRPVRIVHYGDSQIEEDRITKELRLALQEHFGGSGVGLLPFVQNITSQTTRQSSTATLTRKMAYGPTSFRSQDRIYGPMLRMDVLNTPTATTINAKRIAPMNNPAFRFSKVTVLLHPTDQDIKLDVTGYSTKTIKKSANQLSFASFTYNDTLNSITVKADGNGYMYGIMLDDTVGVSVDNIPMRGCSGTVFSQVDPATLRTYYSRTNTKLIILQFTGNSVPYLSTQKAIAGYVNRIRTQIRFMKRQAPDAVFLFIGPSDMLQSKDGERVSYPLLTSIDNQMQQAANEEGIAYWSIYRMMGGSGSMKKWTQSSPALAGKDGIHFTRLGAQRTGQKLTEAIMQGYEYYTLRNDYRRALLDRQQDSTVQAPTHTSTVNTNEQ